MNRRSIIFALLVASFGCIPQVQATPKPSLGFGADTSASDNGWGGGNTKSDLVDGLASYYDTWMHGLAAPLGQPYFHVVLDFASDTTFNSVVAWWHRDVGGQAVPNDVDIQIWNAVTLAWVTVFSTTNARDSLGPYDDPATWTSRPTAFYFATVTSDKLRLVYDNLELWNQYREHGWLHEVSVYNESAVPEPGTLALLGLGLGWAYVVSCGTGGKGAKRMRANRSASQARGRPWR